MLRRLSLDSIESDADLIDGRERNGMRVHSQETLHHLLTLVGRAVRDVLIVVFWFSTGDVGTVEGECIAETIGDLMLLRGVGGISGFGDVDESGRRNEERSCSCYHKMAC